MAQPSTLVRGVLQKTTLVSMALASGVLSSQAIGQALPATATPTREQLTPIAEPKINSERHVSVEGDIEHAPCALDAPAYSNIKIKLTAATFNHLGALDQNALRGAYESQLGKEQSIAVLCHIRDAAATKLRSMGYIAAVQVPVQKIDNGAVSFEVLYAKLVGIRVIGAAGRDKKLLESYLNHLVNGKVFNRFEAERFLLLARDIPGYDIRLSLKPANSGAGDMIGEVTLVRTPVTMDFSAQNLGAPSTGPSGGQFRAVFNGLTGLGDQTILSAYSTSDFKEQHIFQLSHTMLLGSNGFQLGGHVTYALTQPSLGGNLPDVRARTLYANVEMHYPLIRKQALSVHAITGIDYVNQFVKFSGYPLSEDHLRVAFARLDADALDLHGIGPKHSIGWRANASIEYRHGLSIMGASPNCLIVPQVCGAQGYIGPSLAAANPTASVWRASANLEMRPFDKITISFNPRGQISSSSLFAFEKFSAGNYSIGRGFYPGTLTGDQAVGFQAEAKWDGFKLLRKSKISVQPYVFSDNAWLWTRALGGTQFAQLHSLGTGLRLNIRDKSSFDASLAAPVSTLPGETQKRSVRFLLSFTTNILPWHAR